MEIEIKLDPKKLKSTMNVLQGIKGILIDDEIVAALMLWAQRTCDAAKMLVPVKTGALRDDINFYLMRRTLQIAQAKITTKPKDGDGRDYAFYLELGTAPHWVAPVTKQALSWEQDGKRFFSKGHMVSGIMATRFMMRAYLAARDEGEEMLGIAIARAIKRKAEKEDK